MAEDEKKPERWTPGKISFADIKPDPPLLPKRFFEPDLKKPELIRLLPAYDDRHFSDVSMGCKIPEPSCPACDAGIPVKTIAVGGRKEGNYPIFNIDYEQLELRIMADLNVPKEYFNAHKKGHISNKTLLEKAGLKLEGPDGQELGLMPEPMHTHDYVRKPVEGDRMIGIDWGDDDRAVVVMGVIKKLGEPNANGDVFLPEVFELSEPEFVGPFPYQRKTYKVETRGPEHVDKPRNRTAERIKSMTDKYVGTLRDDPHHVPQTLPRRRTFPTNSVKELEEAQRRSANFIIQGLDPPSILWAKEPLTPEEAERMKQFMEEIGEEWKQNPIHLLLLPGPMRLEKLPMEPSVGQLEERVGMIKERLEFLATENAGKLIEKEELQREQYDLYREQQRVEALLYQAEEAEMEVLQPGGDIPPEQVMCPRCNNNMILRMAERGLMAGVAFYGCMNFPHCSATRTVNEVKKIFPKSWYIRVRARGSNQKRLEFAILNIDRKPIVGKRFTKGKLTGHNVFQDFIEPASRAINCTLKQMVHELVFELGIQNPSVIVERMVKTIGAVDPIHTVDDVMLDGLLQEVPLVQKFLGTKKKRELFRVNVERRTHRMDGREHIQLRAKDRRGQTIKSSQMPWEHLDDDHAMEVLITEFCHVVAAELRLGNGSLEDAEQVRECLVASTEVVKVSSSCIKRAVEVVHNVAMEITFKPSRELSTKFKQNKIHTGRISPPRARPFSRVEFMLGKYEIGLRAINEGGYATRWMPRNNTAFDMRGAIREYINQFVEMVRGCDTEFDPIPSEMDILISLSMLKDSEYPKAQRIAQVAEYKVDDIRNLRSAAKQARFGENYGKPAVVGAFKETVIAMGVPGMRASKTITEATDSMIKRPLAAMAIAGAQPGRIKHGMLSSVCLVVAHPGTVRNNREIELHAYGTDGLSHRITNIEAHRLSSAKVVEMWFVNFAQEVAHKFGATPVGVLKLLLSEIQGTRVPEILVSGEQCLFEQACKTLLGDKQERNRTTRELLETCYSPQTQEFIEEQKRLIPQKAQERLERLHKDQEDQRKLDKRTHLYPPGYCKKCHRTGCMCPRPVVMGADVLHCCKYNEHLRLAPIPGPQKADMGLSMSQEWQYCLDCYAIIDYNGVASGRKISNLDAP